MVVSFLLTESRRIAYLGMGTRGLSDVSIIYKEDTYLFHCSGDVEPVGNALYAAESTYISIKKALGKRTTSFPGVFIERVLRTYIFTYTQTDKGRFSCNALFVKQKKVDWCKNRWLTIGR